MDEEELEKEKIEQENAEKFNQGYNNAQNFSNQIYNLKDKYDKANTILSSNKESDSNSNKPNSNSNDVKPDSNNTSSISESANNENNVNDLARNERINNLKNNSNGLKDNLGKVGNTLFELDHFRNVVKPSEINENGEEASDFEKAEESLENAAEYGVKKGVKAGVSAGVQAGVTAATGGAGAIAEPVLKVIGDTVGQEVGNVVAKPIVKILKLGAIAFGLFFLVIVCLFVSIFGVTIDSTSDSSNVNSEISLTKTNLTKEEFVAACNKQNANKDFYEQCGKIYDISIQNKFNPEMVVIRAKVEGFSPGKSKNNYWGLGCVNGGGYAACFSYDSFEAGVKAFIKNVSKYKTVEEMMGRYAYIGHNWYNPGSSSDGGCYYFNHIKEYMSQNRSSTVAGYCSVGKACTGTDCQPTNDEDQKAYASWQVSKMVSVGVSIFGKVTKDIASTGTSIANGVPNSVADLRTRHYFTYDIQSYLGWENNQLFAQCVWYARHRAMEIVSSSNLSEEEKTKRINSIESHSGNGGKYVTNMESGVFQKTTNINSIEAPAVISWQNNSFGHVAIIESISVDSSGKKTYLISEGWRKTHETKNGKIWLSQSTIEGMWAQVSFNTYTTNDISKYGGSQTFVNAAALLK